MGAIKKVIAAIMS